MVAADQGSEPRLPRALPAPLPGLSRRARPDHGHRRLRGRPPGGLPARQDPAAEVFGLTSRRGTLPELPASVTAGEGGPGGRGVRASARWTRSRPTASCTWPRSPARSAPGPTRRGRCARTCWACCTCWRRVRKRGLAPRVAGGGQRGGVRAGRRRATCRCARTRRCGRSRPTRRARSRRATWPCSTRSSYRPADRAHAHVPPHRLPPRRGVRGELVRAPARRDRGGPAAAAGRRRQPRRGARLHRRARRGARLLAAPRARRARARSTTSAAGAASASATCWTC